MRSTRRTLAVAGAVTVLLVLGAIPAAAAPTCSDFEALQVSVHGQHVVRDYVVGNGSNDWPPRGVGQSIGGRGAAVPGGPGPGFHFEHGFAPGASFCLSQSRSPGFHAGQ